MLRKLTTILFLCALFILPGLPTGKTQELDTTPSLKIKTYSASMALRKLVAEGRYVLSERQLIDMVGEYLEETEKPPPHKFPTATDLQTPLESDFDKFFDDMITKATSGLDPGGKLGLKDRLKEDLEQHNRLETEARSRYRKDLDNDLPANLAAARKEITDKQVEQLTTVLKKYVASGKPTAEDIEKAFQDGNDAVLADEIKKEVLRQVDPELLKTRLIDADDELAKSVSNVISDGIGQLKSQLDVLEKKPQSHTLQGIKKELREGLGSLVKDQRTLRQSDRLRKHYGTFPLAITSTGKKAKGHFGRLVATAADQVLESVKNGSQEFPKEHKGDIEKTILAAKPSHHESAESKRLLEPLIDRWVEVERQQWTAQALLSDPKNAVSDHDRVTYSPESFLADLKDIVSRKSGDPNAPKSWEALKGGLAGHYARTLLPRVREEIVAKDARQYSPKLVDGTWEASEKEIGSSRSPLEIEQLRGLNVWISAAPEDTKVLAETWQLWTRKADSELGLGRRALLGQKTIVDDVKPEMKGRIQGSKETDPAYWVNQYVARVREEWQAGTSADEHYRELFPGIRDRIMEVVGDLLKEIKDRKEEEERKEEEDRKEEERRKEEEKRKEAEQAAELREMTKPPKTTEPLPAVDEEKEETEKPSSGTAEEEKDPAPVDADDPKQGGKSTTGGDKAGGADVATEGDGQAVDETPPEGDEKEPPEGTEQQGDGQEDVLKIQNGIVDSLKLDIAEEIEKAVVTQGNQDVSHWADEYTQRSKAMWKQVPLSGEHPDLLPSVEERIRQLTAELLSAATQESMRDRVLARQMAIVDEHRFGTSEAESIAQMIDDDPNATQTKYETLFLERVLHQWQSGESEVAVGLRRGHPDLLSEVKDFIGLIVSRRMARKSGPTGDYPTGGDSEFYRIGFWCLLFMVIVMIGCWYWNVRYLRAYIAARRLADRRISAPVHPRKR